MTDRPFSSISQQNSSQLPDSSQTSSTITPTFHPFASSRFHFHGDTKALSQLSALEKQTYTRHTEFHTSLNTIDRQIAAWTSRFANELVKRNNDSVGLYDWLACEPLEQCTLRVLDKLEQNFGALRNGSHVNDEDNSNEHDDESDQCNEDNFGSWIEVPHVVGNVDAGEGDEGENLTEDEESNSGVVPAELKSQEEKSKYKCLTKDEQYKSLVIPTEVESQKEKSTRNLMNQQILSFHEQQQPPMKPPKPTITSIHSLAGKISNLSTNLTDFVYKTIPQHRQNNFDSLYQTQLKSSLPPLIHLEQTKSIKREGSIVRQLESVSGASFRSLSEENAVRVAGLKILEKKIKNAGGLDNARSEHFLNEVADIRRMVEDETRERVKQDEMVLGMFIKKRELLQRSLENLIQD